MLLISTAKPKRHIAKRFSTSKGLQPNRYSHQNDLPKQLSING